MSGRRSQDKRLKPFERVLAAMQSGQPLPALIIRRRTGRNHIGSLVRTLLDKGFVKRVDYGVYEITDAGAAHLKIAESRRIQWDE